MRTALVTLATVAALMAFLAGMEWATKKLLMWIFVLMVALNAGCTYTLLPTSPPKVRICFVPMQWQCDPRVEYSDM